MMVIKGLFPLGNNLCTKRMVQTMRTVVCHRSYFIFYGSINMAIRGKGF